MTAKPILRTRAPEDRRESVMNSALELFIEQGIDETTVDQITTAASVAKGTFYLYFKSKDDVANALIARFGQQLLQRIESAVARIDARDWNAKLDSWVRACVDGYLDSVRAHAALFYGSHPAARRGDVADAVVRSLESLLRGGVAAGAWSIPDVAMTAEFVYAGLSGAVDWVNSTEKRIAKSRLGDKMVTMVALAVRAHS